MPTMKAPTGGVKLASGQRVIAQATAIRPQRVIHLIAHADFEDVEHLGRKLGLQRVGAEGAEGDADESGDGAGGEEEAVHGLVNRARARDRGTRRGLRRIRNYDAGCAAIE